MRTDTLFYRLFQERPALVFELAGWPRPAGAGYRWSAEEVKETAFRLDGVLLPRDGANEPPVFVEVQFQPKTDFYARWFSEIFLYLFRRKIERPWLALALFPTAAVDTAARDAYAPLLDCPWVQRIYLDEVLAQTPDPGPGLGLIGLILAEPADSNRQARSLYRAAGVAERAWIPSR